MPGICLGILQMALPKLDNRQVVQDCPFVRPLLQALPQMLLGPSVLLVPKVGHPQREVRRQVVRIGHQHLAREHFRHLEVGPVHAQLQPLARGQPRPAPPHHLQALADEPERHVALVQLVRQRALPHGRIRLLVSVQLVGPHAAHARQTPLHPNQHVAHAGRHVLQLLVLCVDVQHAVRQRVRFLGPRLGHAFREPCHARHQTCDRRQRRLPALPQFKPLLERHVFHARRLQMQPRAQSVIRAVRQHLAILFVFRPAPSDELLPLRVPHVHRECQQVVPLFARAKLHRRVHRAVGKEIFRFLAFLRHLLRVIMEHPHDLPPNGLHPARQDERQQQQRLHPRKEARPPFGMPERLRRRGTQLRLLHGILELDSRDPPVVAEKDLHAQHAEGEHRRLRVDERANAPHQQRPHRLVLARPCPEPERPPSGQLQERHEARQRKEHGMPVLQELVVVGGRAHIDHRDQERHQHDDGEQHPSGRKRRRPKDVHVMEKISDDIEEARHAMGLKAVRKAEERDVGRHHQQPAAQRRKRHPPHRHRPQERIRQRIRPLVGIRPRARTADDQAADRQNDAQGRFSGQHPEDRHRPVPTRDNSHEERPAQEHDHGQQQHEQVQHRRAKHLPRLPHGVGAYKQDHALHKREPHDPSAPSMALHAPFQDVRQERIEEVEHHYRRDTQRAMPRDQQHANRRPYAKPAEQLRH